METKTTEDREDEKENEGGKRRRGEEVGDGRYMRLSTSTISRISSSNASVRTPLGALGLALHVALLALRCTGVPDADVASRLFGREVTTAVGGGAGGFAPPVRELPRGQLVPPNWESNSVVPGEEEDGRRYGFVAFRYYRVDRSGGGTTTPVYLALRSSLDDIGDETGGIADVSFGTMAQISNGRDDAMSEGSTSSGGGKEGDGERGGHI